MNEQSTTSVQSDALLSADQTMLQAELERNVCLLRHLANVCHCFGLVDEATSIYLTVQKVQDGMENIGVGTGDEQIDDKPQVSPERDARNL